jgi:hypothetical protein
LTFGIVDVVVVAFRVVGVRFVVLGFSEINRLLLDADALLSSPPVTTTTVPITAAPTTIAAVATIA